MLFCGSYSYLKEKLKEQIQNIEKGEKLTFIVHTNQMKTYLKEYLAKDLGILVNARFYTLIDISKQLTDIEPLQDFDKELILKKFLYEKDLKLDSLPEEFNLLLQQLKEFEINLNNIKSDFVKEIIKSYEDFKGKIYFDREDVHKLSIKNTKNLSSQILGNLFIFGIKSVPNLHRRLFLGLKNLSKNIFVFLPFISDSGYYQNYLHFLEVKKFFKDLAGSIEEEKVEDRNLRLAKYIYKFDYNFSKFKNDNIRIVKADTEYQELEYIAEKIIKLIKKGINFYQIGIVVPQIESYLPFIKEIFKKYKIPYYLVEENKYIDNPIFRKLFAIFEIKQKNFSKEAVLNILSDKLLNIKNLQDLEEKILLSPVIEGFEDFQKFIFINNEFKDLEELLSVLNDLPKKGKIEIFVEEFKKINKKFIKDEKARNFLENIFDSLTNISLYQQLFNEVEYEDFVSIIKKFFYEENKEHKIRANTVNIVSPISAEANNFDYLFFVNINSGNFPSTLREEILATTSQLNGLDYPYHLLMQQILNFCNILDKNKKIYLSYITNSIISGQKAPSILIEEAKRILDIKEKVAKPSYDLTLKDFRIKYANQIKELDKNLKTKWNYYKKLQNPDIKDFQFDKIKINFPISPTKFTTYAYCPYKFFLENIIGIQEVEEPDRTKISPIEKGILVHKILEDFYKNLDLENLEEYLRKELLEIEKKFFLKINDLLKPIIPSKQPFELEKATTLYNRLIKFIKEDTQRLKIQQKEVPKKLLEKEFQNKYFKGKIDRVDEDKTGNYYIYDYKTGENPVKNLEEEIKSKYIQLIIYKNFLENQNKQIKEIGIFAVNDKYGNFVYSINDEETFKKLQNHLNVLLDLLKSKWFYPKENEICSYCQFNEFCIKDKLKVL
ncbi:MAG TPA: PD-(D/E)XK nuclease family protein [Persephonella sp.]|nr:PD-(D/E)XK nuclease family protein [Persephonella sp.]